MCATLTAAVLKFTRPMYSSINLGLFPAASARAACGPDSALCQWGQRIYARGGKNAKKRAIIAVARKLSILLHRLWVTQAEYIPFYEVEKQVA